MENSFEDNLEELEKIVKELEKGELNLDDSVKKFEEGIKFSKKCNEMLENAERKIMILLKQDDKMVEDNFTEEE